MMALGPVAFLSPWLLAGLITLPVIWWLLRFTPPKPKKIFFPPTSLMQDLVSKEQTPTHSPWWLTALRILLAALIIAALARPILNPQKDTILSKGPMVIIIDNGWASANSWQERKAYLDTLITRGARESRSIALIPTAGDGRSNQIALQAPSRAHERAESLKPLPYPPNRLKTLEAMKADLKDLKAPSVFWLSDGLDYGNAETLATELKTLAGSDGSFTIVKNASGPLGLTAIPDSSGELKARIIRSGTGSSEGILQAWSGRGARLGEAPFTFAPGDLTTQVKFDLPLELRNQVARLEIAGIQSAGTVHLLDSRSQRQRVGLISGESRELSQPLLSPLYYIERALGPFASLITSKDRNIATAAKDLLDQKPSALILSDIGTLGGNTYDNISRWVDKGGVLIRFAGPRLEKDADELLPVALRQGGRALGGALSWSTPQKLAAFEEDSLFHGLEIAQDVTINRQVLADPARSRPDTLVWARLQDGTPLVTAAKRGKGWLILFHITANSDWSKLPHSGLFVEMLKRLVELSNFIALPAEGTSASTSAKQPVYSRSQVLTPLQTLDGFGRLIAPPPLVEPINIADVDKVRPSAKHPPGYYGPATAARAINVINLRTVLMPFTTPPTGTTISAYTSEQPLSLKPWLLAAALGLFFLDALAVIALSGGFTRQKWSTKRASSLGTAAIAAFMLLSFSAPPLKAQESTASEIDFALKASLKTRLAYVLTGNAEIDGISHKGLDGLSRVISARTAIEPAEPMGVNINTDELSFFPILYWPIREDAEPLPEKTLGRIDAYMKQGGLILFDTRDHQQTLHLGTGNPQGPGAAALQRLLGRLDIPRLQPVPNTHVLTKAFYLLRSFPGRWDGGTLWVEAQQTGAEERRARHADGVSSILITSNDFATAWALDERNRPLYPVVPGGEMQREMSFRTGINIVMYALTGNYKADQVHIPALLERLGQ